MALDWRYNGRLYLLVPLGIIFGVVGAVDLLDAPALWQRFLGGVLVMGSTAIAGFLARWLRLPVDEESLARLKAKYEEMRIDWRGIWDRARRLGFRSRANRAREGKDL